MKEEGLTRFIGFSSMNSAEKSRDLIRRFDVDVCIIAMNPTQYGSFAQVALPAAREKNVGVFAMKVMRNIVGKEATEARFLEVVGEHARWRALHFACHGLVDTQRPMRSALALTPDEGHDGRFTVLDVMGRDLPTDLAVLSACDTGRGQVVRAEGIVGLTRAFMAAGAPRVLCSLWKVDDRATRTLMERFYARWNPKEGPGISAAKALREAQASVRAEKAWHHPRYWAAWSLWGVPD